jgi:hypothetical protein
MSDGMGIVQISPDEDEAAAMEAVRGERAKPRTARAEPEVSHHDSLVHTHAQAGVCHCPAQRRWIL